jgi:serine/threonine protein kinase
MTPERWQQVKGLFDAALERGSPEREFFLDESCRGDPELRNEVDSLLAAEREAGSRYDSPIVADAPGADLMIGRHIASYKIVRRLGTGGMGAVYLASRDDEQFRRLAAIKIIRPELSDENTRRRFDNERQTLAALEHPNIVKLLDGGTTEDGSPYLIMDYVEGQPIDRFVRERDLSINERLELFRTLCGAVHYAHQNLIVHRDLKPANILVTPQGVPKLLDFGIAKLLRPAFAQATVGFTRTNAQPMTPEYASPEQILGQPITTATDIYSLGTLLYTLLTGTHPYQVPSQSYHELEVSICEGNARKPSAVLHPVAPAAARQLRGDLDTIVLTAMRKEPQRRYRSAEHLAEDVRRHLQHEPLAARPDTWLYRSQKFVERNTLAVAASVVVAAALVTLAVNDRIHRLRAEKNFQDLRSFANFAILNLDSEMRKGMTQARQKLATKAVEYLDGLAPQAKADTSLKLDLIRGYLKTADLQGNLYGPNVGDTTGAKQSIEKALQLAEQIDAKTLEDGAVRALVVQCQQRMGDILASAPDRAGAVAHYSRALAFLKDDPKTNRRGVISATLNLAQMQFDAGDMVAAENSYRDIEPIAREWNASEPSNANAQYALTLVRQHRGELAMFFGDPSGAEAAIRDAIAFYETDQSSPGKRRNLAIAYYKLAEAQERAGKSMEALASCRRAMQMTAGLLRDDNNNQFSLDQVQTKVLLIKLLVESNQAQEARKETAAVLDQLRSLVQSTNPDFFYSLEYVRLLDESPFAEFTNSANTVAVARRAVEVSRDYETLDLLARAQEREGSLVDAEKNEREALALLPALREGHPKPENRRDREAALARMQTKLAAQEKGSAGRKQTQD